MAPRHRSAASRTQEAYQGIRQMLFHNEISPGQKISYRDLSERLGMSQTPVIQALKWLEFQQLVRHEPNRGYYIETVRADEVAEIYDFRELIELSLLGKTFERLTAAGLRRIRKVLDDISLPRKGLYELATDDTVICRCEEVTLKQLKTGLSDGSLRIKDLKRMTRMGMGHCQGRMCGPALQEMIAREKGLTAADLGYLNPRPPAFLF